MSKIPESDLILNQDGSIYHLNIKPEHLATDKIITVGDPGMVHMVSQHFEKLDFEMNKREFITHVGKYHNKNIAVMSTGVGTDNIEIFYNELDALFNVNFKSRQLEQKIKRLNIIRLGTSTSLQEDIKVGSIITSDYAVGFDNIFNYYKLPQTEFEKKISNEIQNTLALSFKPYCVKGSERLKKNISLKTIDGNTITSPGFYAPQGRKIRLGLANQKLYDDLMYLHYDNFWLTDIDMETAGHYAMARLLGHEVISLNAIIANRINEKWSKDSHKLFQNLAQSVLDQI